MDLLSKLRLGQFAEPLSVLGVRVAGDVQYVSNDELTRMGMAVVDIRKIREQTGEANWASEISVQHARPTPSAEKLREDDHYPAPDGSQSAERSAASVGQSAERSAASVGQRSERGCVPQGNDRSPAPTAEEIEKMVNAMQPRREMAENTLREILAKCEDQRNDFIECLQSCLRSMRNHMSSASHREAAKEAASAMSAASRALAKCPSNECELRASIARAEMNLRDLLVLATQLHCPLGDRDQFVTLLEVALGMTSGCLSLSRQRGLIDKLMHSHSKVVVEELRLHNSFLSNAQLLAVQRHGQRRPRRSTNKPQRPGLVDPTDDNPSDELDSGGASSQVSNTHCYQPPPGLEHAVVPRERRRDRDGEDGTMGPYQ